MGDIKDIFKQSLDNINTGRAIAIPYLLAFLVPVILILLFVTATGASSVITGIVDLKETRDSQRLDLLLTGDAATYQADQAQMTQDAAELIGPITELLTFKNLVWFIILSFIIGLFSVYISCFAYAMILLVVKAEEIDLWRVLRITHRNFFRYIFQRILVWLIVFLPAAVFIVVTIFGFMAHWIIGVLFILIFAAVWTIYIIYVTPRLMYSVPAMFVHNRGPWSSIRKSFSAAHNNIKRAWVVFGVMYASMFIVNAVIGKPMMIAMGQMLSDGPFQILMSLLLLLVLLCCQSVCIAFINIFIFNAYIDQEGP
jgi:MFS family permease